MPHVAVAIIVDLLTVVLLHWLSYRLVRHVLLHWHGMVVWLLLLLLLLDVLRLVMVLLLLSLRLLRYHLWRWHGVDSSQHRRIRLRLGRLRWLN